MKERGASMGNLNKYITQLPNLSAASMEHAIKLGVNVNYYEKEREEGESGMTPLLANVCCNVSRYPIVKGIKI